MFASSMARGGGPRARGRGRRTTSVVGSKPQRYPLPRGPQRYPLPRGPQRYPLPRGPQGTLCPGVQKVPSAQGSQKVPSAQGSPKVPSAQGSLKVPSAQGSPKGTLCPGARKVPSAQGSPNVPSAQGSLKGTFCPGVPQGVPSAQGSQKVPSAQGSPNVPLGNPAPHLGTREVPERCFLGVRKPSLTFSRRSLPPHCKPPEYTTGRGSARRPSWAPTPKVPCFSQALCCSSLPSSLF